MEKEDEITDCEIKANFMRKYVFYESLYFVHYHFYIIPSK